MVALASLGNTDRKALLDRALGGRCFSATFEGSVAAAVTAAQSAGGGRVLVDGQFDITAEIAVTSANVIIELTDAARIRATGAVTSLIRFGATDGSTAVNRCGVVGAGKLDANGNASDLVRMYSRGEDFWLLGFEGTGNTSTALLLNGEGARTPTSITSSGAACTVSLTSHGYSAGDYITVYGCVETAYNGTWKIAVTDANTFTFTAASTPSASPATGTIRTRKKHRGVWVEQVTLHDINEGLYLSDLRECYVGGNRMRHFNVGTPQDGIEPTHCERVICEGNHITFDNYGSNNSAFDIFAADEIGHVCRDIVVIGNTIELIAPNGTNSPGGINVGGDSGSTNAVVADVVIADNIIRGGFAGGVNLNRGATRCTISGGEITGIDHGTGTSIGIDVSGNSGHGAVIQGVRFLDSRTRHVNLAASRSHSAKVLGNWFGSSGSSCVYLGGAPTSGVDRISDNVFSTHDGLRSPSYAIGAAATVAADVDNNDFRDATYGTSVIQGSPTGLAAKNNRGLSDIP